MQTRPNKVPSEAFWDEGDNEWVHGQRNDDGEFIGVVEYYRPDGTLCCKTTFVDGTPHGLFQRFHENGEPSRTGAFDGGALHGTNRFVRSTGETTENFPRGLNPAIWACEMDYDDGDVVEGRLYDRQERRVMENGEPFPETRPADVPADAHFRKPAGEDEYVWVAGASTVDEDNDVVRLGVWRHWTPNGALISATPHDDQGNLHGMVVHYSVETGDVTESMRFEHGQRIYERPSDVPADAVFDEEDELWTTQAPQANGKAQGESRCWDEAGRLRKVETYVAGDIQRVQEHLADGTLAQDSTFIDNGVPQRKWCCRSDDEELDSFPNVCHEHPSARVVEYLFNAHGMMESYSITDGAGTVLENETVYRNAANDTEQRRFATIEDASRAWIAAGEQYTADLNRWLAELYDSGEPSFEEPTMDDSLERATIEAAETLNERGEGARARQLFPRYYDGIGGGFWGKYGAVVDNVLHAGDTLYAGVIDSSGERAVMSVTDGVIKTVPGAIAMGASHDKRYLAWAHDESFCVVDKNNNTTTFAYPQKYGHTGADALRTESLGCGRSMSVRSLRILPGGDQVVLISAEGIYLVSQQGNKRLYPLDADMDTYVDQFTDATGGNTQDYAFDLEMNFANADVSPNAALITCGGMFRRGIMAGLAIWKNDGGELTLNNTSQADSFFPTQAVFHRERAHIAFAATLYASLSNSGFANTTFRIDLEDLEDGEIDEFAGGVAQERGVVNAVASFGEGFLLGYDNGYVRWMGVEENAQLLGYLFVGGSIRHIDVSPDQRSFVVASDSGLVVEYRLADKPSSHLITTMNLADNNCAAFFRTFAPMIW